jgi:beta-glucanase (GH16 family)
MHLVFSDDFSGSSLDTEKWDTCYPWSANGVGCTNFSHPELEWYEPSQDRVSKGVLSLTASKTTTKGRASNGALMTYPWRSGMVTTHNSFDFTYGYVDVRARLAEGDGLWSALWLLPETASWPPEIDLAELWGDNPTELSVVFHGKSMNGYRNFQTSDLTRGWHTFAVDWEPGSIVWYVDGTEVFRYQGPGIPRAPMFFIANLAVANFIYSHPTQSTPTKSSLEIRRVVIQH